MTRKRRQRQEKPQEARLRGTSDLDAPRASTFTKVIATVLFASAAWLIFAYTVGDQGTVDLVTTRLWLQFVDFFFKNWAWLILTPAAFLAGRFSMRSRVLVYIKGNAFAKRYKYRFRSFKTNGSNVYWREGDKIASANKALLKRTSRFGGRMLVGAFERYVEGNKVTYETSGMEVSNSDVTRRKMEQYAEENMALRDERLKEIHERREVKE
ncbi:MAG: hypothetical protein ACPHK8_03850 [Thermoplasmatota archaeon]